MRVYNSIKVSAVLILAINLLSCGGSSSNSESEKDYQENESAYNDSAYEVIQPDASDTNNSTDDDNATIDESDNARYKLYQHTPLSVFVDIINNEEIVFDVWLAGTTTTLKNDENIRIHSGDNIYEAEEAEYATGGKHYVTRFPVSELEFPVTIWLEKTEDVILNIAKINSLPEALSQEMIINDKEMYIKIDDENLPEGSYWYDVYFYLNCGYNNSTFPSLRFEDFNGNIYEKGFEEIFGNDASYYDGACHFWSLDLKLIKTISSEYLRDEGFVELYWNNGYPSSSVQVYRKNLYLGTLE